jgi:hypothetical protein
MWTKKSVPFPKNNPPPQVLAALESTRVTVEPVAKEDSAPSMTLAQQNSVLPPAAILLPNAVDASTSAPAHAPESVAVVFEEETANPAVSTGQDSCHHRTSRGDSATSGSRYLVRPEDLPRLHKILGHPSAAQLLSLLRTSSPDQMTVCKELQEAVSRLECAFCV